MVTIMHAGNLTNPRRTGHPRYARLDARYRRITARIPRPIADFGLLVEVQPTGANHAAGTASFTLEELGTFGRIRKQEWFCNVRGRAARV